MYYAWSKLVVTPTFVAWLAAAYGEVPQEIIDAICMWTTATIVDQARIAEGCARQAIANCNGS